MVVPGYQRKVQGIWFIPPSSGEWFVQSGSLVGDLDGLSADWNDWSQNSAIWCEPPISWLELLI
jgi:hypothetical protein